MPNANKNNSWKKVKIKKSENLFGNPLFYEFK